jgi:hypothetical protein
LHDLLTFDLKQVDLWHLPQTEALLDQKVRSLDPIDDFWYNRLYEGDDWPNIIMCEELYDQYLKASSRIGKRSCRASRHRQTGPSCLFRAKTGIDQPRDDTEQK